ncbi:MAG TPA: AIM24 family protein [Silvibacterium sp.]|nr:AIM24 family protein [Silvibacterium sp.]
MFCTHCGSRIQEGANFCTSCGTKAFVPVPSAPPVPAQPAPASTPAPVPVLPPAPVAVPMSKQVAQSMVAPPPGGSVNSPAVVLPQTCPWCGAPTEAASGANCPRCGAVLQVRSTASLSGWLELPPRKDMAKLQFGNSSCQIEGLYVPVADMNLAAEDSVYFSHHMLLWMEPQITMTTMPMRGGWKRVFAGLPLIMAQARGPGHIAFSKDQPGELIALPLHPGQAVDVREHMFLVATSVVEYDWFQPQIWYQVQEGKDAETIYPVGMFMDRFSAPAAPGLLLLHAGGSVLVRQLGPGETILVKPTALVFKDPTVQMQLHLEHPNSGYLNWGYYTNRCIWLRLFGPGRVAIQSVFERVEKEGGNLVSYSNATIQRW